jgi:hypothetical protein
MPTVIGNLTRVFQGKALPWVDIRAIERANPGRPVLFEVVKGDGWHRFRYGFQIAESGTPATELTKIIKEYHRTFPGAKLYLSQGR